MKFAMGKDTLPNGTVLLFGIYYDNGSGESRVFTYAMLKAASLWYVTGGGRVPSAAGWGAVARWLEQDGRQVAWVQLVTDSELVWDQQRGLLTDRMGKIAIAREEHTP